MKILGKKQVMYTIFLKVSGRPVLGIFLKGDTGSKVLYSSKNNGDYGGRLWF